MKRIKLFLALSVLAILLCGISSCSKEESDKPNTEQPDPEPTPEPTPEPAPEPRLCPFCRQPIADDATRCPHCTSELPAAETSH